MPRSHRLTLRAIAVAALTFAAGPLAWAQDAFPSRPIKIVVPYAAGGTTDQLARAIQKPMSDFLGQPVLVDNKPGAGGTIGTESVVRSTPDGYTILFGNTGPNAVVGLMRKIPYDPLKDLRPISIVAFTPMILAVAADSPARNLKEFMELARQKSASWNYGSVGNGSLSHLTSEYFNNVANLKLLHIPYNGGAPMLSAFVGGQLNAAFVTGLDGAAMLNTGKVRYLAVGTPRRTPVVPDLPAVAEEVPGFRSVAWFGVLAPRAVPDAIAAKLNAAVAAAVARPDIQKMFTERNIEARSTSPEEMETVIKGEIQHWGEVIKRANIKID